MNAIKARSTSLMGLPAVAGFLGTVGITPPAFWAMVLTVAELVGGVALIVGRHHRARPQGREGALDGRPPPRRPGNRRIARAAGATPPHSAAAALGKPLNCPVPVLASSVQSRAGEQRRRATDARPRGERS